MRRSPAPKAPKAGGTGRKGKRGKRSEEILGILGDQKLKTGEINDKLDKKSANLSAVLAGMVKAGKIGKTGDKWRKA